MVIAGGCILMTDFQLGISSFPPSILVNGSMLDELAEKGMGKAVKGLDDPRARMPELLLTSGWERHSHEHGAVYSMNVEDSFESGQSVEFGLDKSRTINTIVNGHRQSISISADGQVKETYFSSKK